MRGTAALALSLIVVCVGAALAIQRIVGPEGQRRASAAHNSGPKGEETFPPWASELARGTAAGGSTDMPVCSYAEHALFCAQRGVKAAKLDAGGGRVLWSQEGGSAGWSGTFSLAPALSGGVLHIVTSDGSRLEGLDPSTGRLRWDRDISRYGGGFYDVGAVVLLVSSNGQVTAIDSATGKRRWQRELPGHTAPVFVGYGEQGRAYAVEKAPDGRSTLVSAVDPEAGTVRWQRRLDGELTPIGVSGGALYLTSSDGFARTDAIVRYEPGTGAVRRVPLVLPVPGTRATVDGGMVYLLGYGGSLLAVDARSPGSAADAQRWRVETSVTEGSAPVVVGDRLYFTAADGRLLAVDAKRGALVGQTKPRPSKDQSHYVETLPSPIAADGRVFAIAPDGSVFAVDATAPSRW
jgi:outer membrane protein assembly factor BamB